MVFFTSFRLVYTILNLDLVILHLLDLQPGNTFFKLIALVILEDYVLGIGHFGLVDPEAIQCDCMGIPRVITWETAHFECASRDKDHYHIVAGPY